MNETTQEKLIIFTLWLLVFASASQIMIVAPILPRIAEELHVAKAGLGLLVTVYAVCVGIVALITGPISDRFGRRRILLVGSGLLALALGLHGLADSYPALLAVRALAGAAGGILSGGAVSYVGDYFPIDRRGWASGWVMSGLAAGQIAGIPLGTLLAKGFGFRAPFLAFALLAMLAFLFILVKLPQPPVAMSASLSLRNALRSYRDLLRRKEVIAAAAAFVTMFMGISLFVTFFPTWLEETLGFSTAMISILYLIGGVGNVAAGPQAGALSDRIGRTRVIIVASVGTAVIMPLITLVTRDVSWLIYPLFFVMMAMVASRMSPLQALMTQLAAGSQRGALMSLVMSIGQVGFGLGSGLAALTVSTLGFTGNALIAMLSVMIMASIVWIHLRRFDLRPGRKGRDGSGGQASVTEPATPTYAGNADVALRNAA